jgi:4-phosphopantoate--beta-alanine ligase
MTVPESHPRYNSLKLREKLIGGYKTGIVAEAGLIAHGRGEAFDYLLGETTVHEAELAEMAAASFLKKAKNPVISVNGNVAALCPSEIVELANEIPAKLEVNLFHRTEERMNIIIGHLKEHGAEFVLGADPDAHIPGLAHSRALCVKEGIYSADVVLVPLEDGDRAQALRDMGKTTIVIDLNPLSRSAQAACVTIIDEVTRAIPNITRFIKGMKEGAPTSDFYNKSNLETLITKIRNKAYSRV